MLQGIRPNGASRSGRHSGTPSVRRRLMSSLGCAMAAGAAGAAYMAFEAQWVRCRCTDLVVPGLPPAWTGLSVLHLSDVHAGLFPSNECSLRKVVRWAAPLQPDLVLLTGDILGAPRGNGACMKMLSLLQPKLGMFAVTGNHEYGIGQGPFARARRSDDSWAAAGATLLRDQCVVLTPQGRSPLVLCGADYLTAGYGLVGESSPPLCRTNFSILLIHEPPGPESPLANRFQLAFAGHTHGGQIRVPKRSGLAPLNDEGDSYLGGVYNWGNGLLVVSRGVGTSFVPLRLFTRPEATLWRLV